MSDSLSLELSNHLGIFSLTGDQLGKILMLLLKNKEFEKACTVMEKLDKNQQNIAGVPKIEALSLFVDQCIEEKAPSKAIVSRTRSNRIF